MDEESRRPGDGCQAAVRFGTTDRYWRCRWPIVEGVMFCAKHGGPRPAPRVMPRKSDDPAWRLQALQKRRDQAARRIDRETEKLRVIRALLEAAEQGFT
jgi:hypothetical protein